MDVETKVVGITDGQPVEVTTTTSQKIMDMIEELRSTAAGEKHVAVGMFIIDDQGRQWVDFYCERTAWLSMVGAASLLQHRIMSRYEQSLEGSA